MIRGGLILSFMKCAHLSKKVTLPYLRVTSWIETILLFTERLKTAGIVINDGRVGL